MSEDLLSGKHGWFNDAGGRVPTATAIVRGLRAGFVSPHLSRRARHRAALPDAVEAVPESAWGDSVRAAGSTSVDLGLESLGWFEEAEGSLPMSASEHGLYQELAELTAGMARESIGVASIAGSASSSRSRSSEGSDKNERSVEPTAGLDAAAASPQLRQTSGEERFQPVRARQVATFSFGATSGNRRLAPAPLPPLNHRKVQTSPNHRWPVLVGVVSGLVVLVVVLVSVLAQQLHRQNEAVGGAIATFSASPFEVAPVDEKPVVAVITTGSGSAAQRSRAEAASWAADLATDLDASVRVVGSGYLTRGAEANLPSTLGVVNNDTDVVIFVGGSSSEAASQLDVANAATRAFSAAGSQVPAARLLALGPFASSTSTHDRDAISSAAALDGVTWVDPIDSAWFGVASIDGNLLTEAQNRVVAERLAPIVRRLIRLKASSNS